MACHGPQGPAKMPPSGLFTLLIGALWRTKGEAEMVKIAILSLCLVVAPFLQAENISSLDTSGVKQTSVYVFSDFRGILYIDRKAVGRLRAQSKKPLQIYNLRSGDHLLQQRIPDGEIINCDIESNAIQDTYVYMRVDGPRTGRTLEELNYQSRSHPWIYWVAGAGILTVVAIVALIATAKENPIFNWENP